MTESPLLKRILLAMSRLGSVGWRNNVGVGWMGRPEHLPGGRVLISHARAVRFGLCVGSSDIIGCTPVQIRPEHVGQIVGVLTAIEVKTSRTRTTKQQVNFLKQVAARGGIAILARSENDVTEILGAAARAGDRTGPGP